MIYMFIYMFVRVLYPKNLLHFAVAVALLRVVYGLRDAEGCCARPPLASSWNETCVL
jgi:hypothetical protein